MAKGIRKLQASLMLCLLLCTAFSGCYGEEVEEVQVAEFTVEAPESVLRGQYFSIEVTSDVDWTMNRSPGFYYMDEYDVLRDDVEMTFDASQTSLMFLVLDSERSDIVLTITSGAEVWNATLPLSDSEEYMLVDGRRAYETIDMLTTDYNNRWCASASLHEGGAGYQAAAEKAEEMMWDMGFDHVEITQYADDPDQLNIVGYNWGRVSPDEYIVIGGHFDIAYMFTPPGGGTNEGANDDTSGSTVSLEVGQALAQMEFDHTVVAMEAGVANPWRQQGGQFESHNGRQMRSRAFELVEGVKGFN